MIRTWGAVTLGTLATFALCVGFPCLTSFPAVQGSILMHLRKLGTGVAFFLL